MGVHSRILDDPASEFATIAQKWGSPPLCRGLGPSAEHDSAYRDVQEKRAEAKEKKFTRTVLVFRIGLMQRGSFADLPLPVLGFHRK